MSDSESRVVDVGWDSTDLGTRNEHIVAGDPLVPGALLIQKTIDAALHGAHPTTLRKLIFTNALGREEFSFASLKCVMRSEAKWTHFHLTSATGYRQFLEGEIASSREWHMAG